MAQNGDNAPRPVVKKVVVRKRVAAPDQPPTTQRAERVAPLPAEDPPRPVAAPPTIQAATPVAPERAVTVAKPRFPWRPRLWSLRRPDVRGRFTELRYAITDRVEDGAYRVLDAAADGRDWVVRRVSQLSSVQIVAVVGALLVLLALAYGWGFYQLVHPRNGNR